MDLLMGEREIGKWILLSPFRFPPLTHILAREGHGGQGLILLREASLGHDPK